MDAKTEIWTAKNWYIWLWISPLLTIPTLFYVYFGLEAFFWSDSFELVSVLASGLWHLVLLVPALRGKTEFIRWHGRQALMLAGVRTLLAMAIAVLFESIISLIILLLLILVWLIGNIWGQGQARRGDCALMRWTGHGGNLPLKVVEEKPVALPTPEKSLDELVKIFRFSSDPVKREAALAELRRRGAVEEL